MSKPLQIPYEPFPTFVAWQEQWTGSATFERFAALLEETRKRASEDDLQRAVRVATKQAAVDTGAIENLYDVERGFTFTVATEAAAWESMHTVIGTEAARAIEDALAAYDYVLDLATQSHPLSEQWIRQLHQIVCRSQESYQVYTAAGPQEQKLPKGQYKDHPNSPLNLASNEIHSYAPPSDTPPEMARLVAELNSANFHEAHPAIQASYAHYAFVCIHPFADGNGRVARALASIYLYRRPGIPLVIFADEKATYLDALESADRGNYAQFCQFISDRAVDTIQMVRATIRRGASDAGASLAMFSESLTGRGGLQHEEMDALAARLSEEFSTAAGRAVASAVVSPPLGVEFSAAVMSAGPTPEGYRGQAQMAGPHIGVKTSGPGAARGGQSYRAVIGRVGSDADDFAIVRGDGSIVETVLLREVHPVVSASLRYRLELIAETELQDLITQVAAITQANLERGGYR